LMPVDLKDITVDGAPAKLRRDIGLHLRPYFRFLLPVLFLLVVTGLVTLAANRWNTWVGQAPLQSTDDAYVSADVTRLSTRISGQISSVAVVDFQSVKEGELLIQIDPADYQAQVDLASATLAASQAALDILSDQI